MSESSNGFSDIEKPEYLRGQIAGLQQICALLINRLVPIEGRGEIVTALGTDRVPILDSNPSSLFSQGLANSFVKVSDNIWR